MIDLETEEYLHDLLILLRTSRDQDEVDYLEMEIEKVRKELAE